MAKDKNIVCKSQLPQLNLPTDYINFEIVYIMIMESAYYP